MIVYSKSLHNYITII